MKKVVLSLVVVFIFVALLFSLTTVFVSAETNDTVVMSVENVCTTANSEVDVKITIKENPGIAGAMFTVSYDSKLTLTEAVVGDAFASLYYTAPGVLSNPCKFHWDSLNSSDGTGTVITLKFTVSEDAEPNESLPVSLSYKYGDFYDDNLDSLTVEIENGSVKIIDYIPGDVNGDGTVNGKDVTLIRRYNVGGYNVKIRKAAADVNDDGVINGKDVTLIRRYNVGGYGVVLKPSNHNFDYDDDETVTITWKNFDGSVLKTEAVGYGETPSYVGEPTRPATEQYTYVFSGWDPAVVAATVDATYTATYTETTNKYTVTWVDGNGDTIYTKELEYGATPAYDVDTYGTPTKTATAQNTYTFSGWEPQIATVTADATYTAQFDSTVNQYTITWKNGNTTIYTEKLDYGATPAYDEATYGTPEKTATAQYTYTFNGWNPQIVTVTADATYTAQFTSSVNQYTVTWKNGSYVIYTEKLEYGATPAFDDKTYGTPEKTATAQYSYTFNGWEPTIDTVTGDVTYTAKFTSSVNQYTVTWKNGSDIIYTEELGYGATPVYDVDTYGTPTKTATAQYTYTFNGWNPQIVTVTADATYTAQFDSTVNQYTITWKNGNTTIYTEELEYGITPVYDEATYGTPEKAADAQYTYTFSGWDPQIATVTADATYTAQFTATAIETTKATITVEEVTGNAGDTVEVGVSITDNPGFLTLALEIDYDDSALTLTKVANGSDFSDYTITKPKNMTSGCKASWYTTDMPEDIVDGDIMILTFKINDDAASGTYEVTVADTNDGSNTFEFDVVAGSVTVEAVPIQKATITVEEVTGNAGDTVEVGVSIADNPGFLTLALEIDYDDSALTLTKVANGSDFSDYTITKPKNMTSGCKASWYTTDMPEDIVDGDIMILTFKINDDAAAGTYEVTVADTNDGSNTFEFDVVAGSVTVEAEQIQKATITVEEVTGNAGDTVEVGVSITDNPGFLTLALEIDYDDSALTLTKVANGSDFSDYTITKPKNMASGCKASWYTTDMPEDIVDGDIMILTFKINDNAAAGTYEVTVADTNDGSNTFEFDVFAGSVTVEAVSNNPKITVAEVESSAGSTNVKVAVSLKNNPGFLTLALNINYDDSALTLTKVANGSDFSDYTITKPKNMASGCRASWYATDMPEDIVDGDVMILTFTVKDTAAAGTYEITVADTNDGSNTFEFDIVAGGITVK